MQGLAIGMVLWVVCSPAWGQDTPQRTTASERIVQEGVAVEFAAEVPNAFAGPKAPSLREGEGADIRFAITDATTRRPLTRLRPSVWIDPRRAEEGPPPPTACRAKIQSFLQGSLRAQPEIDLNTYYLLTLNREPNISVIDPLLGFGGSKLRTLVMLPSPGQDWVMNGDQSKLFVSLPASDQVAVVDTKTWKVAASLAAGPNPEHLALQHDGRYLWVDNQPAAEARDSRGVTVIDAEDLKVVGRIATGTGAHRFAFSPDDRYAFVTNGRTGTVSVVDVRRRTKLKDVKTGAGPKEIAFSPRAQAAYVAHENGDIAVIDGRTQAILSRIPTELGLGAIRFTPDGRWGFAINPSSRRVHVIDAATNRLAHTLDVSAGPDQVAFTSTFAYLRSAEAERVTMIPLSALGKAETVPVSAFAAGQAPPASAGPLVPADAVAATPEGNAVVVANPADKTLYYYAEGMNAPMGSFQNYGRIPNAVLVVDRSLREQSPGTYSATVQLAHGGIYDVAFLLDNPRVQHCFSMQVAVHSAHGSAARETAVEIEPLLATREVPVNADIRLQFRVKDSQTGQPRSDVKDLGVLTLLPPGTWQQRYRARASGNGLYEIDFRPPQAGVYYVFFESPSLGIRIGQTPHFVLRAVARNEPPAMSTGPETTGP